MIMSEHTTIVTRKGQITVPIAVRRALNLKQGDRVVVTLEADGAKIVRRGSIAAQTAGMFRSNRPPLTAEEEREEAEWAVAEQAVKRMGG
jgi:AbrB family looped-hinge helix DNA binding protein